MLVGYLDYALNLEMEYKESHPRREYSSIGIAFLVARTSTHGLQQPVQAFSTENTRPII
jgi:hypothetical protein